MDTLRRPEILKTVDPAPRSLIADALLIAGFVLMVLGIMNNGGLVSLTAGFILLAGAPAALADMRGKRRDEDEAFFRITDNM